MKKFDLIVIGAGSGGLNVALAGNAVGLDVLMIDKSELSIGGECLNTGCVPSKALIHAAKEVHVARKNDYGLKIEGEADFKKVMKHVRGAVETIRKHESSDHFRKLGITVELGEAKFVGKRVVQVGRKQFKAKRIVIATGSRPRTVDLPNDGSVEILTNENVFDLKKLPKKLVIVGGGPIGVELGQSFARLGSDVHIVQRGGGILDKESEEVAKFMLKVLKKDGITFHFNSTVKSLADGKAELEGGKTIEATHLLFAIGRIINQPSLGLDEAGIKHEKGRIAVNKRLQTSNKAIYVIGDSAGSYQFTHAAEYQAQTLVFNLFSPFKRSLDNRMAWVTFSDPEIAAFGLSKKQLDESGQHYQELIHDLSNDDRAITQGESGFVKLYIHKDRLLGGVLVMSGAGEVMQELIYIWQNKLKFSSLFSKIYPYPTASRVNRSLAGKYVGQSFGPFKKSLLTKLFRYVI